MYKFNNLNQALIGMSKELLEKGVKRKTRGFDCIEFPTPVLICIDNPTDRYINIPERKWNKVFGFVESLWIASGTNHMKLVGDYVPNMYTYSDDGQYMRAAYGPRIRAMQGFATDYKIDTPEHRNIFSGFVKTVDQLKFVVDSLKRDINTRQALITIHDPVCDDYDEQNNLKVTKDTPCCRTLQFMVVDGKLDCTLTIRSNDVVFGFSAVNVFNFTLMQEYVAAIIGVSVGKYYHFVNNLHFYSDKLELVECLSKLDPDDYKSEFGVWEYKDQCSDFTFEDFDQDVNKLFYFEKFIREEGVMIDFPTFKYSMFNDWGRVFFNKWNKGRERYTFDNPYLNKLFGIKNKSLYDYSQVK
jgi:thymidylate synthase